MGKSELFVLVGIPAILRASVGDDNIRRLHSAHPRVRVAVVFTPEEFSARLLDADGVVGGFSDRLAPALSPGGRLRWIHSLGSGANPIMRPEIIAAEHVTLTSSKGPMGPMMAEHIIMLMMALARSLPGYLQDQAEHRWRPFDDLRPMLQLHRRTIAILGVGAVGGNLARACKVGFGMRVLGFARRNRDNPHVDRYFERSELHDILAEADYVALALPGTLETRHIVDAAALRAMKPSAYLVNVGRGDLIDGEALVDALKSGQIAGAGLDTPPDEPLPPESPLWDLPNVIITPHVAPARDLLGAEMVDFWCENIRRFAEGEPLLGLVDRHARY
jgi:D-2-hydroxyacid dehydrogenase (NADP+)